MSGAEQLTLHLPLPDFTHDQAVHWLCDLVVNVLQLTAVEPYADDLVPRIDAWLTTPCNATEQRLTARAHRLAHDLRLTPWADDAIDVERMVDQGISRCADVALASPSWETR